MRRLIWLVIPAMLLVLSTGALAQGTPEPEAPPPTVFVRQDPTLGSILSDPSGRTLYLFTNDTTEGESTCYDKCATNWPPFTATEPLTMPEFVEGTLTTVQRTDGTTQVAYNGIPLYYFIKDENPGDVNGQGVGDVWYVVHPGQQFGAQASPTAGQGDGQMATPAAGNEVTVELSELTVTASRTDFKVGETYTFNVTNTGAFPHEFYIEKAGAVHEPLEADGQEAEIGPFDPGTGDALTWTFTEPGNYQLACHVRQHYPNGMALTIHVTE
jgi:predicted lipoprotein with Yx(FWY)xxD motif/uncharacterized cupredoxin-like copper-binding protein